MLSLEQRAVLDHVVAGILYPDLRLAVKARAARGGVLGDYISDDDVENLEKTAGRRRALICEEYHAMRAQPATFLCARCLVTYPLDRAHTTIAGSDYCEVCSTHIPRRAAPGGQA